jgi:hypothetical protein
MKIQLEITSKTNKNIEGNERKKNKKWKGINGADEKMNWRGGRWDLLRSFTYNN